MSQPEETPDSTTRSASSAMRLAVHAGTHLLVWLLAFGLFAAADSWHTLTGLGLAALLSVITAILAGLATTTLIHEWFHFLGARLSGGNYEIPARPGLFVFDWDFSSNSVRQFYTMSWAGTVGGAIAVALLWATVPTDNPGRAALLAAGIGGFAFAAAIEWPVLRRTRGSRDPLAELSKIDQRVLLRSLGAGVLAGVVSWSMLN